MQYISFNAKTVVTADASSRPPLAAALNNWVKETEPAGILPIRFDYVMTAHDGEIPTVYMEPIEEYLEADPNSTAWKVVTAWTAAAVGGWALVIGCVMIARALFP